jgi:hypothetical protein
MPVHNQENSLTAIAAGPLRNRIWDAIQDLQDAGYSHAAIINDLLFEAGWMVKVVGTGEAAASKAEVRGIIAEFCVQCDGLVDRGEVARRPDHH